MMNDGDTRHRATVFLDRDGTLNRDVPYLSDPERLTLFPGVIDSLARLNREGVRVVLVTNQSGVARGRLSLRTLDAVHARLQRLLQSGGARLDGIYYCPHLPEDGCLCRKPRTGLVERACQELGIHIRLDSLGTQQESSRRDLFVVGDQPADLQLAEAIGGRGILVTTGPTRAATVEAVMAGEIRAERMVATFSAAVDWILDQIGQGTSVSTDAGTPPRSDSDPPLLAGC